MGFDFLVHPRLLPGLEEIIQFVGEWGGDIRHSEPAADDASIYQRAVENFPYVQSQAWEER